MSNGKPYHFKFISLFLASAFIHQNFLEWSEKQLLWIKHNWENLHHFFFYYSRKNKTMLCKNKERTYFWFRSQQTSMCACETSFFVIPEKLIPSPLINEPLYYFSLSIKMDTMIRVLHILLDVCCFVFFCLY